MKNLSKFLIVLGLICYSFAGYYIWLRNDPNRLKFANAAQVVKPSVASQSAELAPKAIPTKISIKDLGIDLPITQAKINNNTWETTENGVSYLSSSPLPGEKGNSILYGHNWANLLGPLMKIRTGQEIEVQFSDRSKKRFVVEYTSVVSPDESSILAPSKDKRITLYTCTGFLDSQRFVVVAILK
jgi:LPXTG-site transpeptidase (sortase) family protein